MSSQVSELRRRFKAVKAAGATAAERRLAGEMRVLRERIIEATGSPEACARCVKPCPTRFQSRRLRAADERPSIAGAPPPLSWAGGSCCGGDTQTLFSDDELAALFAAGTRPRHLRPPRGETRGCTFRGRTGCSLAAAHRPSVCVVYVCRDLARELHAAGRLDEVEALGQALKERSAELASLRAERGADAPVELRALEV